MIRIENIGKVFNPRSRNRNEVLKGVSFELPDKGLICIYGKSGSGKTTLLNIIGGLDKQDTGKIYIDNNEVGKNVDYVRNQKIGFIFQNYYLEKGYTIAEIMHNAMVIAGFKDEKEIKKRAHEVLDLVDMERFKNKQGDALSGGQKQRVAIARALIKGADIILADEPTGNLDAENTMKVMDILKEISKTKLVVVVTHEVTLIKKYADSYIQLVDGKLTDKDVIGEVFKYEVDKNNIYVDEETEKTVTEGNVNVKFYGENLDTNSEIKIFTDNGKIFINASKNVTIIDDKSEKKLVFKGSEEEKAEPIEKKVPKFEHSTSKRNGKLFTIKNILKSEKNGDNEKAYSTANIFKQIFIMVIAVVMCVFSMMSFEVLRVNVENKMVKEDSIYVNINAYPELRRLNKNLYESIDLFETQTKLGNFSYSGVSALSGIKANYTPRAIELKDDAKKLGLVFGTMPVNNQVLITRGLAEQLKKKFRIEEFNNDKSLLLVTFENEFEISGIINGDNPAVYMHKEDYINFLGVYNVIQFRDNNELFFSKDYINNSYSSEIVYEPSLNLKEEQTIIEISRNALYKMMPDIIEADYIVKKTNGELRKSTGRTSIEIKNSKLYVSKFDITREAMESDIRIYISKEALNKMFIYLEPNLNSLQATKNENGRPIDNYFEINTNSEKQFINLRNKLESKKIPIIDVNSQYEVQNKNAINEAVNKLTIFIVIVLLLYIVFFFIEKSGSIKNSKEYGIYRAIGVNKSNLLYKELIVALFNNMISYTICYIITSIIMLVGYNIMNVVIGEFVGILVGIYVLSSLIMVAISLIPYLFVTRQTPSQILSKYDI